MGEAGAAEKKADRTSPRGAHKPTAPIEDILRDLESESDEGLAGGIASWDADLARY
jgi:hypothetical protein